MHYPIDSWNNLRKGAMHLHGHCHLPNNRRLGKGKRIDAGIDGHLEFRPYHLMRELVPLLNKQPIHSEIEKDHHTDEMLNVVG